MFLIDTDSPLTDSPQTISYLIVVLVKETIFWRAMGCFRINIDCCIVFCHLPTKYISA
jgi:hypothetical protein